MRVLILLMDKILHDLKDPKLWELWYFPYNGEDSKLWELWYIPYKFNW